MSSRVQVGGGSASCDDLLSREVEGVPLRVVALLVADAQVLGNKEDLLVEAGAESSLLSTSIMRSTCKSMEVSLRFSLCNKDVADAKVIIVLLLLETTALTLSLFSLLPKNPLLTWNPKLCRRGS